MRSLCQPASIGLGFDVETGGGKRLITEEEGADLEPGGQERGTDQAPGYRDGIARNGQEHLLLKRHFAG